MAKKQTDWQKHLMATWKSKKGKKDYKFSDAMRDAAKTFKK